MIATSAEKNVQRSQRSYGNHSPAIVAITGIICKPLSSDRSDHSDRRMHCVADSKIPKFPLLEDLPNPNFMSSLSFPPSFTLKSTHEYKKPTFKQESTLHSRHVEFDEWREQCVRRRPPRPSFTFSAIVAITWKPAFRNLPQAHQLAMSLTIEITHTSIINSIHSNNNKKHNSQLLLKIDREK